VFKILNDVVHTKVMSRKLVWNKEKYLCWVGDKNSFLRSSWQLLSLC